MFTHSLLVDGCNEHFYRKMVNLMEHLSCLAAIDDQFNHRSVEGLTITLIEAPCFCVFLDFSQVPSNYIDGKPHYIRATLYLLFSIAPFFFCVGFSTFIACSLMLITSGLYLMKSLGRKASRSEMAANAISSLSTSPSAILVQNEAPLATSINKPSGLTGEIPSSVTY